MGSKMDELLTPERKAMLTKSMEGAVRAPIKEAVREAMEEAETDREPDSGGRGISGTVLLLGVGAAIGYLLRGRGMDILGPFGPTPEREGPSAAPMTRPEPTAEPDEPEAADDSSGRGLLSKALLVGAIVGIGYLLRSRTGAVDRLASGVRTKAGMAAEETEAYTEELAKETETMAEEAAERVAVGGETVADRIETGGEEMAEEVEETGEEMAEEVEEMGERAEEMEEEVEERAEDMQEAGDSEEEEEREEE